MLSNAFLLANFRFDTAVNEPEKHLQNFAKAIANFANFAMSPLSLGSHRGARTSRDVPGLVLALAVVVLAVEIHRVALLQQLPVGDVVPVHEDVLAAARGRDEAEALLAVVELYGSGRAHLQQIHATTLSHRLISVGCLRGS